MLSHNFEFQYILHVLKAACNYDFFLQVDVPPPTSHYFLSFTQRQSVVLAPSL